MSAEEDTELKNLVAQTLENKGILPKIRAELRANVFLALEENPNTKETLLKNDELSAFVKVPIGKLILNLIREFLDFFELGFTLSVFDPETKYGKDYNEISKDKMMKELKISECDQKNPLLYEVIARLMNSGELRVSGCENNYEDMGQGDVSESIDGVPFMPSPLPLNSTYVKGKSEVESLPLSPIDKEDEKEDENDTIKEELLPNNISDSDSIIGPELNLEKSPRFEKSEENIISNSSSKESKLNSPKSVPKGTEELDLLIFTPVKETIKTRENSQSGSPPSDNEKKINEKKENDKLKSMSVLGDLPPLPGREDERGDKINKIKAIMDKWPGLDMEDESSTESKSNNDQINDEKSSTNLKSDRSEQTQKSERTESVDDFEEDISDLLNGHTTSDGQVTVDETVSKVSCEADYLESV